MIFAAGYMQVVLLRRTGARKPRLLCGKQKSIEEEQSYDLY